MNDRSPNHKKIAVVRSNAAMIAGTGMCGTDGVTDARMPSDA
jgi:hypothetical protein